MNEATIEQPLPKGKGENIVNLVIKDLNDRANVGAQKYGEKLKAFNGRNALIDAYQESLDMCQYLKQQIIEDRFIVKTDNPWCIACKEIYCEVSTDGTCNMVRRYLEVVNV
jgi:hypothetical protein